MEGTTLADLGGTAEQSSTSSGGSTTSKSLPAMDRQVAEMLVGAVKNTPGHSYTLPVFDEHELASEIPEEQREELGLPEDVTHTSVESLVPIDMQEWHGYDSLTGLGSDLVHRREDFEAAVQAGLLDPSEVDQILAESNDEGKASWSPDSVRSTPQSDVRVMMVGHHADLVTEAFSSQHNIKVRVAPDSPDRETYERWELTNFFATDSATAAKTRERSRLMADEITESEYSQWCEANGYDS